VSHAEGYAREARGDGGAAVSAVEAVAVSCPAAVAATMVETSDAAETGEGQVESAAAYALWRLSASLALSPTLAESLDATSGGKSKTSTEAAELAAAWRRGAVTQLAFAPILLQWCAGHVSRPLCAAWLARCAELAGHSGVGSSKERDQLSGREVIGAAEATLSALATAAGRPLMFLRRENNGTVCGRLHRELTLAESSPGMYRTRRLAHALAVAVRAIPRPDLGKASDSHKLLPLLLRWAEDLHDPCARGAVLSGLRHCVYHLPTPELHWHGVLLLTRLRKLFVFREQAVWQQLLPTFVEAWRLVQPALNQEERLEQSAALVDDLQREFLYACTKPEARRLFYDHLPPLLLQLGLRLCTHLPDLVHACCELVTVEVKAAVHVALMHERSALATVERVIDLAMDHVRGAMALLQALLRSVWPRAATHATLVLQCVLGAYLRTEDIRLIDDVKIATGTATEVSATIQLLETAGGSVACRSALALMAARAPFGHRHHHCVGSLADALRS